MKGMWNKMTGGGGCQQFDRWMTDSLAGELTPEQQAELDAHLDACAVCRAEFAARRNAWALTVQSLLVDPAPAPLSDAARKTIEDATTADLPETPTKPARSYNIKFVWMEIAASVIIVGVVLKIVVMPYWSLTRCMTGSARAFPSSPVMKTMLSAEIAYRELKAGRPDGNAYEKEMADYAPPASTGPAAPMPTQSVFDAMPQAAADSAIAPKEIMRQSRSRTVTRYGGSARQAVDADKGAGEGGGTGYFAREAEAKDADSPRSTERRLRDEESRPLDDTSESGPSAGKLGWADPQSRPQGTAVLREEQSRESRVGGRGLSEPQSNAEADAFGGAAGNEKRQACAPLRRSVDTTMAKPVQADEKLDRLTLDAPSAPPAPGAAASSPVEERKKTEMSAALFRRNVNAPANQPMTTAPAATKSRSAEMADNSNAIADGNAAWKTTSGTRTSGSTGSLLAKNKQDQTSPPAKPDSAGLDSKKDALREREMEPADAQHNDGNAAINEKLRDIILDDIEFEDLSMTDVINELNERSRKLDPDKKGVKFVLDQGAEQAGNAELDKRRSGKDGDIPTISIMVGDVPLGEVIRYISHCSNLKYRIEDDTVVFYAPETVPHDPIETSVFDIDAAMYRLLGGSESEVRNYLAGKGIVLDAENSVSYDAASGKLILRHRPNDLKTIQGVVEEVRATADEQRELSNGLPFIKTGVNPTSTFSIDVDTASYALAQRYLRQGQRPPPERVRPEEFINAFNYAYRSPENALFGVYLEAAPDPFRPEHTLFRIGVQGRRLGADVNRPSQFTLLIDTSGSMGRQDRIGLAKKSVSLLLDQLRPQDRIAVLTCGYRSQVLVPFTPAARRKIIERLVAGLQPQGEANLERGFVAAYQYALDNFQAGAGNRVVLFTDGIAGFGASDADTILAQVETARRQGVTNTVVGFGGDGNDNLLEALANRGDGSYVFLNNEDDARTLFEKEFAARFHEIARDVKIQVEFNPGQVAAYRQIGYQNRQLSKADFRNDQVDAGEVGAGQSVTALYELQPVAMAVLQNDALRVRQPLATVRIRYRRSDTLEIEEREFYLFPENLRKRFDEAEPSFQLAAAVAEFAETLRYPDVPGIASPTAIYDHVQRLYGSTYRNQPNVHEFMTLVGAVR